MSKLGEVNFPNQQKDILNIPMDSFVVYFLFDSFYDSRRFFLAKCFGCGVRFIFFYNITISMLKSDHSVIPEWLREYDDLVFTVSECNIYRLKQNIPIYLSSDICMGISHTT